MSAYGVSKFLFAFNSDAEVRSRFKSDPGQAMDGFPLEGEERTALQSFDFKWLLNYGVHPLQLTALANGSGIPIPRYLEAIRS